MRSVPSARSASSAAAYALPSGLHKDPADRILVGTARLHDLTLLTGDGSLRSRMKRLGITRYDAAGSDDEDGSRTYRIRPISARH
ncbi:MAG: hypothetical protein WBP34_16000 [Thermoanaerobaculia bacterium]